MYQQWWEPRIGWADDGCYLAISLLGEMKVADKYKDRFELMQFTGLLDKNGKEIYEGDILLRKDMRGRLFFHEDKACFYAWWRYHKPKKDDRTDEFSGGGFDKEEASESEVIGNIYSNPELL